MNTKNILFIVAFFTLTLSFNIKNAAGAFWAVEEAFQYIGADSQDVTPLNLILRTLYGHTDLPYTLPYLLANFGNKTTTISRGNLIIGNDGLLGGIVIDTENAIIPVPDGKVSVINSFHWNTYFPNNYTMKQNFDIYNDMPFTIRTVLINNTKFCRTNNAYLSVLKGYPVFDLNIFWVFQLWCRDAPAL